MSPLGGQYVSMMRHRISVSETRRAIESPEERRRRAGGRWSSALPSAGRTANGLGCVDG